MTESSGWEGIGFGVETRQQQVATVFDGLLFAVAKDQRLIPKTTKFLTEIDPATGLANKVLVARAAADFNDTKGRFIVVTYEGGKEEPFSKADVVSFSVSGERIAAKPAAAILLNANSRELTVVKRVLFIRQVVDLKLTDDAAHQTVVDIAKTQSLLEKDPEEYLSRNEYFALLQSTGNQ